MDKDTTRHTINIISDGLKSLFIFALIGLISIAGFVAGLIYLLVRWLI